MASAAPGVSARLTLAGLAAATAYSGGLTIIIAAVPMLVIANGVATVVTVVMLVVAVAGIRLMARARVAVAAAESRRAAIVTGQAVARLGGEMSVTVGRKGFRAELDRLRERMRACGISYDEMLPCIPRRLSGADLGGIA
jgi:hypothetical protein